MRKNSTHYFSFFVVGFLSVLVLSLAGVSVVFSQAVDVGATVPALCGNGAKEGAEACDGNDLYNKTCVTNGFAGGLLSCKNDCTFDTSACQAAGGGPGGGNPPPGDGDGDPPPDDGGDPGDGGDQGDDGGDQGDPGDGGDQGDGDGDGDPPPDDGGDPGDGGPGDGGPGDGGQPGPVGPPGGPVFGGGGGGGAPLPAGEGITLSHILFSLADGRIEAQPVDSILTTLSGDRVIVGVNANVFGGRQVDSISVRVGQTTYPLSLDRRERFYLTAVRMGSPGRLAAELVVMYTNGLQNKVPFIFLSQAHGRVTERGTDTLLPGTKVTLWDMASGGKWNGAEFGQTNPVVVSTNATYGFVVPNGSYKLIAEYEGYHTRETLSFAVRNHVIAQDIKLIKIPPKLSDVLNSDLPRAEKAILAAQVFSEQAKEKAMIAIEAVEDAAKKIDEVADDPKVEAVTKKYVAPSTIGVATVAVAPSLTSVALPLLRYIFFQPLLLVGRRKRREWGVVYNSLTKLPVDLAVVRLIDTKTNKIKQSRVSDAQGRYLFVVEPGEYMLEVTRQGFSFPSALLKQYTSDGELLDLYHGESIEVTNEHIGITPNIPVDPVGIHKTPTRLKWEKRGRRAQHVVSLLGIVLTAVALYIVPSWLVAGFLVLHVTLYVGFVTYVKPKKPQGWGIVYDKITNKPVANAVVRLFTKEYNKLVSTQITDSKGRYAFLVGPSTYYVHSEKEGYTPTTTQEIEVKGKPTKGVVLKEKVGLDKQGNTNQQEGQKAPNT